MSVCVGCGNIPVNSWEFKEQQFLLGNLTHQGRLPSTAPGGLGPSSGPLQEPKSQTLSERRFGTCYSGVLSSFSRVRLFATPWTVACQALLSIGFFQAKILEWVAMPPPGDLPDPGIKPASPALQADSLPLWLRFCGKESACNSGGLGSVPGLGRYSGEGTGLTTPVFLPGKFHGQWNLVHGVSKSRTQLMKTFRVVGRSFFLASMNSKNTVLVLFL